MAGPHRRILRHRAEAVAICGNRSPVNGAYPVSQKPGMIGARPNACAQSDSPERACETRRALGLGRAPFVAARRA